MSLITETLVAEHAIMRIAFDYIELVQDQLGTVAEIRLLGGMVSALLHNHAAAENELVLVALDHVLAEQGQLRRLHEEHQESDERLVAMLKATDPVTARRLLLEALAASRAHFDFEERIIFPFIERVLKPETLSALNEAWQQKRQALAGPLPSVLQSVRTDGSMKRRARDASSGAGLS